MNLTPYRQAAKQALINWNGVSEEEAQKMVETLSFEELENMTGASGSVAKAAETLAKKLGLSEERTKEFVDACLGKEEVYISEYNKLVFKNIYKKLAKVKDKEKLVLDVLSDIHDEWVANNAQKFSKEGRENKKFQHLPLELIGYKEATLDLLFFNPILNTCGIELKNEDLQKEYNKRVNQFLEKESIYTKEDLSCFIFLGSQKYSVLKDENSAKTYEEADIMSDQVMDKLEHLLKFNPKFGIKDEFKLVD